MTGDADNLEQEDVRDFLEETDAVVFVVNSADMNSYKIMFEKWIPKLKEILTEFSRADVPKYVLQNFEDQLFAEEDIVLNRE